MSEKVVYEKHPVTAERKAELRKKGYKIIDSKFAPEGYEHPEPIKATKGKAGKTNSGKQGADEAEVKAKLQAALTEKGVEFGADASLEDLQKLLDEAK
ncbi:MULTISPECIES: hypothetical protein [Pseudomonas]|uniref:HeH/LEM domain-containing protein n=1 Tax=Pseudomonas putida TaxID=303 RepID=A0A1L7NES2_PSEPU|nr:hypothetical protein [Pseudomonas putida]BAW23960.1 hypothetical protein KF715C_ch33870 [Pseudomonas putida]